MMAYEFDMWWFNGRRCGLLAGDVAGSLAAYVVAQWLEMCGSLMKM